MTSSTHPTCFVVTGFGQKTDYPTGRVLNLDLTFSKLVRPACDAVGINAFRAIDANVTGSIDLTMYRWIYAANYVIADLSTLNANVFYELGVRHAQRPYSTLIIAESMLMQRIPFDLSSFVVHQYQHDGDKISQAEQDRFVPFAADLLKKMQAHAARAPEAPGDPDSPIFTFLKGMIPPEYKASTVLTPPPYVTPEEREQAGASNSETIADLMAAAEAARKATDFPAMITLLNQAIEQETGGDPKAKPDLFLIQRLVLATYKAGEQRDADGNLDSETAMAALIEAESMLEKHCAPWRSTDPETLGLLGAINKRMFDHTGEVTYLDRALQAYERGFFIKQDYYNGINAAFMYTLRAGLVSDRFEAIANHGQANMLRRRVVAVCNELLESLDDASGPEDREWIYATLAEAAQGLGDTEEQRRLERWLENEASPFVRDSYNGQKAKLAEAMKAFDTSEVPAPAEAARPVADAPQSFRTSSQSGAITIIPETEPGRVARAVEVTCRIEYE